MNGIKIKPEHKEIVEKYKETIRSLNKQQDAAYEDLTTQLGGDSDWLFEYIYNDSCSDEYSKFIKEQLFM
jgi:hemerythrin